MSKIKVDTLESNNQNVKLTPDGTGVVEVKGAGGADGSLKLVSSNSTNGATIKSPAHSAGQSYTLVLPDNQPATNKLLKIKSITGSGATAVGQLEYGDPPQADLTQLNANDITSGTVPAARFPASLPPSQGAALKLISHTTVSSAASSVAITIPTQSATYLVLGKRLCFSNNSYIAFEMLDSGGSAITQDPTVHYGYSESLYNPGSTSRFEIYGTWQREDWGFHMQLNCSNLTYSNAFGYAFPMSVDESRYEFYTRATSGSAVHQIRFSSNNNTGTYARSLEPNTEFLLYQYVEY